jgi:hypothetical protein
MVLAQDLPVPADLDPLTRLPIVGDLVALVDQALRDAGIALWLAEAAELLVLGIGLYQLLKLLAHRVLPRLLIFAVPLLVGVLGAVRVLLLAPQPAVTAVLDRRGTAPPSALYSYGDGVLTGVDSLQAGIRQLLPPVSRVRVPGFVLLMSLVTVFLLWNYTFCDPSEPACVRPITQWVTLVSQAMSSRGR